MEKSQKLSTESYKGVRDFYPEDQFIQNYIFEVWQKTAESFGYTEYSASILEPTELYKAKSGEEIVNEQTYSFKDRGDRDVTLRPEMTPTVARMVAGKRRELKFPLRLFSIPNLFRYERPQRGRLREHWQLNCDMFGVSGIEAEVEMITMADQIMKNFGLEDKYVIKINYIGLLPKLFKTKYGFDENISSKILRIVDKFYEKSPTELNENLDKIIGKEDRVKFIKAFEEINSDEALNSLEEHKKSWDLVNILNTRGVKTTPNVLLTRGFDYYTGIVFQIYDKNPENPRALFGGGRYDDLLSIFGEEPIPTVGFGMGDVTIRDVLETYGLLPEYKSKTLVSILPFESKYSEESDKIATALRQNNINVSVDYSDKKIGDKISKADKEKIRFVIVVGEDEIKNNIYKLKELSTKKETLGTIEEITKQIY